MIYLPNKSYAYCPKTELLKMLN